MIGDIPTRLRRQLFDRFSGRLVLVILVVSLLPLAASTYISSTQTRDALDEQSLEVQKEAVTRIAQNTQTRSELFERQAQLVQDNPYVQAVVRQRYGNGTLDVAGEGDADSYPQLLESNETYQRTQEYFQEVAETNSNIWMIRVYWQDGEILTGYKFKQEVRDDYVGDTYWFERAMSPAQTGTDDVYVSAINIEQTTGGQGQPMIRYAVPFEIDGERVGIVVINYAAEQITDPVSELQIGETGFGALLDPNYINSSGAQLGEVYVANGKDPFLTFVPAVETVPVPERGSEGRITFETDGEQWIGYYQRMTLAGDRPYHAVVAQREREVSAPARQIVRNGYVLVAAGIPVILLVGILASRRIARPIEQFASEAERVAEGELDHEITQAPESSVRELRLMTASARRMKAELVSAIEYEEIFDSIRDPIFVYGIADPGMLAVNDSAVEKLGYPEDDLLAMDLAAFTPADAEGGLESLPDRIAEEDPLVFEATFGTSDGEQFPVEINATGISYYGTDAILGVIRDISNQKRRQRELESYEVLFENTSDCIVQTEYVDGEPIVWQVNAAFEETFGYTEEEIRGQPIDDVIVPEEFREEAERINREERETGDVFTEVTRQTADGRREFLLRSVHFEDDTSYAIYTDITDRKRRERQLEEQNERLEKFASVVSHDLRNPLNVAQMYSEMAEGENVAKIRESLDRMETIIEDVLAIAKGGQTVEETEQVDLSVLAGQSWNQVETGDATLSCADDLVVEADPSRCKQLFENLFRNAVEHGSTSSQPQADDSVEHAGDDVTVRIGSTPDGFYVEDDGPGIPESEREAIFEAGYTSAEEGTGLGLNIVQEIARAHGWTVAVTDGTDGGARFEFAGVDRGDVV